MPSGVFTANAAWLVCAVMAFNLTRTAGAIAGTRLDKATTATIRRKLVAVPARIARRSRRLVLHLPDSWRWESQLSRLFDHAHGRRQRPQPFRPADVSSAKVTTIRGTTRR